MDGYGGGGGGFMQQSQSDSPNKAAKWDPELLLHAPARGHSICWRRRKPWCGCGFIVGWYWKSDCGRHVAELHRRRGVISRVLGMQSLACAAAGIFKMLRAIILTSIRGASIWIGC